MDNRNTCLVIVGPTASGKTAVAIQVARKLGTEIISADARQCYRELDIGVAKPSPAELLEVPHHFINSHSIQEEVNAAVFESYALNAASHIFAKSTFAVMAGGSGLYIKAFVAGMDEMFSIPPEIRKAVRAGYENFGLVWLREQLQSKDPGFFERGEGQNPHRMMRSLEVKLSTGMPIRDFQKGHANRRPFRIIQAGIAWPREALYRNIEQRVDNMMERGLLGEVERLYPFKKFNALNTVGYKELFSHLEGGTSLDEAVAAIKRNTRQYAKRQMTWFRRDPSVIWMNYEHAFEQILQEIVKSQGSESKRATDLDATV